MKVNHYLNDRIELLFVLLGRFSKHCIYIQKLQNVMVSFLSSKHLRILQTTSKFAIVGLG